MGGHPTTEPVLEWKDLRVARGDFAVGIDALRLGAGETAALVGPSGCGKSTLLFGWTGLDPELTAAGAYSVQGAVWPEADTRAWRELLAGPVTLLPQDAKAALDPLVRIGDQIGDVTSAGGDDRAAALRQLALEDPDRILRSYPHEVSGGQAQRVLLAIAWLRRPALLLADEPTASLDEDNTEGFVRGVELLRDAAGTALVLATHDERLVRTLDAQVYRHRDGRFVPTAVRSDAWATLERNPTRGIVLQAIDVHHAFRGNQVLRGVDLAVDRGEIVAVVGPSGCGKSTLARILAGHLRPDRGLVCGPPRKPELFQKRGITAADRAAMAPRPVVQMLFQDAYASLTPHRTVRSLVDEVREASFVLTEEAGALGFPIERLDHDASALSGGERRRAAMLRALAVRPPVLVLDEPTASLDRDSAVSVMDSIVEVQRQRRIACVWITHDPEMAKAYAHRVLTLREGRLEE